MMNTWLLDSGSAGGRESHDAPSYFAYYEDKLTKRGVRLTNTNSLHREASSHGVAGPTRVTLPAEAPESAFDIGELELSDSGSSDLELLPVPHD